MARESFDFTGKNAVVTGGRRGIGRACALALARRGANVVVIARAKDGAAILAELAEYGTAPHYLSADLSRPEARRGLIAEAERLLHGGVDILVNNAGTVIDGTICTMKEEDYISSRELLMDSPIDLMRQALPGMMERRYGKIVNISSIFGIRNSPGTFTYSVFKRAVIAATECAAKTVAPYRVNVNCIAPGTVRTELTESRGDFSEGTYEAMCRSYPAGHLGEAEDIAAALLYLVSDAASFVHGHTLVVDGGYLL